MYGAGLRLLECARLRIKDVDFERREIRVRDGKGRKDRVAPLPATLIRSLTDQERRVQQQHEADVARGAGYVELPDALSRKSSDCATLLRATSPRWIPHTRSWNTIFSSALRAWSLDRSWSGSTPTTSHSLSCITQVRPSVA
jgi:integrase